MTHNIKRLVERAVAVASVLALGSGITVASLLAPTGQAFAFGQVSTRSVELSSSTPSASNVSYQVTFTAATGGTAIKSMAVDFCTNDPIVGDTCSAPAGFSVNASPSVTVAAVGAQTGGTWSATSANTNRTLLLSNAGSITGTPGTASAVNFTLSNATNPSSIGTFYARIFTFANAGDAATWAAANTGNGSSLTGIVDAGGAALSIVNNVSITTRVQETLSFCTSGTFNTTNDPTQLLDPMDGSAATLAINSTNGNNQNGGSSCAAATTPSVTIGHGSPTAVIDNSQIDTALAFTQASTNAQGGMAVRMKATNTCAGLSSDGGTTCNITGANNTTAAAQTAGTTFFGLYVSPSFTTTGVSTSQGTMVPDNNYYAAGCTIALINPAGCQFGMDNTSNSGGVNSTYGDVIANSSTTVSGSGAISSLNNKLMFGATAGLTVPAGIYTGQESLIATGTF